MNLALSLHSAKQETRERIIPLAKKASLEELRATLEEINRIQQREVMIEYLMLADVNDSIEDAEALITWLGTLQVHVNLIPYNPIDDAPHLRATPSDGITAFADRLKQAGLTTTVRYSLGSDIAAACGQLIQKENRHRAMEMNHAVRIGTRNV